MFEGPIGGLIYFLFGLFIIIIVIVIIFFIIYGLIKIFKFINRTINYDYTQLPINTEQIV